MGAGDYQIVVRWLGGPGQGYALNVLHAKGAPGIADQAKADDVADAIGGAFVDAATAWDNVISSGIVLKDIRLREINPDGVEFVSTQDLAGAATGDQLPPGTSLVTSLVTEHVGRRGRGRIYNYGFVESGNTASGRADATVAQAVTDGWKKAADNLALAALELAVYSRLDDETYVVVGINTDTVWDSQRRRKS